VLELNNSLWKNDIIICLTFDLDWASEDAIKYTLDILQEFNFHSTFFITHPSPVIMDKIRKNEVHGGIHPNFLKNSSHGNTYKEVLRYLKDILPNADCFRCHKYYDSNDITELLYSNGFKYDSNLCTNLELVQPFVHRSRIIRYPIFFEDGGYLLNNRDISFKNFKKKYFKKPGLYIFNFHPMHININSPDYKYMRKIKDNLSYKDWNNLIYKEISHFEFNGYGIRNFILELFRFIKKENFLVLDLEEVYNQSIMT